VIARAAARALVGEKPAPAAFEAAGRCVAEHVTPDSDLHASSDYRRQLASVLARRALARAAERAATDARR
jgi:carbon-monoxide dehydrogenase medium subunit